MSRPRPDTVKAAGLSSQVGKTDRHAVFWDLEVPEHVPEGATLRRTAAALMDVITTRAIPWAYLIDAGRPRSFHAIAPVAADPLRVASLMEAHPYQDQQHVDIGLKYGRWILRVTRKPPDPYAPMCATKLRHPGVGQGQPTGAAADWLLSRPHLEAVERIHGAPKDYPPTHYYTRGEGITVEYYATTKTRPQEGGNGD